MQSRPAALEAGAAAQQGQRRCLNGGGPGLRLEASAKLVGGGSAAARCAGGAAAVARGLRRLPVTCSGWDRRHSHSSNRSLTALAWRGAGSACAAAGSPRERWRLQGWDSWSLFC